MTETRSGSNLSRNLSTSSVSRIRWRRATARDASRVPSTWTAYVADRESGRFERRGTMGGRTQTKKAPSPVPIFEIEEERERMFARMSAISGVMVRPSMGRYVFFTVAEPEKVHHDLIRHGVPVRDVSKYPRFANTLRVAISAPEENELFLESLVRALA